MAFIRIQRPQAFAIPAIIMALPSCWDANSSRWDFKQQHPFSFLNDFVNTTESEPVSGLFSKLADNALKLGCIVSEGGSDNLLLIGNAKNQPGRICTLEVGLITQRTEILA